MTFEVLIFAHRLPGVSPTEFKHRYDRHMSLVQEMTGAHFPPLHTRRYIQRADDETATVLAGSQADFDFDALAEMVFESEEAYKMFYEILCKEDNARRIEEDEKTFFDRERVKVVGLGETEVTERRV